MNSLPLSPENISSPLIGSRPRGHTRGTEVLTQEEIDSLLTVISSEVNTLPSLVDDKGEFLRNRFTQLLKEYSLEPDVPPGMFTKNSLPLSFRSPGGEEVLADLRALNQEQGGGNISVPGTDLELINFSHCPRCSRLYSYNDLREYYRNPPFDPTFPHRGAQFRQDPRVVCMTCGQSFLPALVIADRIPRNEVAFLCRLQTIHAVETFWTQTYHVPVLSQKPSNLRTWKGRQEILNDLSIAKLAPKPGLILNILQYSTPQAQINFLDGRNLIDHDPIYGRIKNEINNRKF